MTTRKRIELFKRRIVAVLEYFDEEREVPWYYVQRASGRFEAIASHTFDSLQDGQNGVARERSVGVFDTCDDAMEALRQYRDRVMAADYPWRTVGGGMLDLDPPVVN
jgi:hypothetical protein